MIFGPIKFLMKLIIMFLLFVVFVVLHNTEFGAKLEHKIGKALEYESLKKTGLSLYGRVAGSSAMDDIDAKKIGKNLEKKVVDRLKETDAVKKLPARAEKIVDEERKRLEDIIEGGS